MPQPVAAPSTAAGALAAKKSAAMMAVAQLNTMIQLFGADVPKRLHDAAKEFRDALQEWADAR